jgi:hypothetical protein
LKKDVRTESETKKRRGCSFSMSQDISRAMTASTQKTEKTRSVLIDGMPPAPPEEDVLKKDVRTESETKKRRG